MHSTEQSLITHRRAYSPLFILLEFHDDPTFTPLHLSTFAVPDHRECLSLMFLPARRAKGQGRPLALPLFVPQPRLIDSSVPSLKHLWPELFFEPCAAGPWPEIRSFAHFSTLHARYHDITIIMKRRISKFGGPNYGGTKITVAIRIYKMDEECFARRNEVDPRRFGYLAAKFGIAFESCCALQNRCNRHSRSASIFPQEYVA